jgi:hypothetical protein
MNNAHALLLPHCCRQQAKSLTHSSTPPADRSRDPSNPTNQRLMNGEDAVLEDDRKVNLKGMNITSIGYKDKLSSAAQNEMLTYLVYFR